MKLKSIQNLQKFPLINFIQSKVYITLLLNQNINNKPSPEQKNENKPCKLHIVKNTLRQILITSRPKTILKFFQPSPQINPQKVQHHNPISIAHGPKLFRKHNRVCSCLIIVLSDEKINNLIQKNDRLKTEIRKIQKVLKEATELEAVKPEYGIKLPEIRSQVADRELENAYKQIKHYEFEIQKLKELESQGTYATRLTKAERSLKEKLQFKDKLKIELEKIQKSSKNIGKSLADDRTKILLQNKSKKLNDQLKMYEKKWSQDERKRHFFMQTQRKKRQYIVELEQKLKQSGVDRIQVEQIRRNIFQAQNKQQKDDDSDQEVEDRSPQAYKAIVNQLKLLKKVTVTNQKLLQKMQTQREQYSQKNKKLKINIDQVEKQIEIMQNQITFLKKHVDPTKLKPNIKAQGSFNSRVTFNSNAASFSMSEDTSSMDPFANRNKNVLEHHFEFVEIGNITKRSEKFNDRKLLGKRSAKIIAVELYQNRMQLLGFRFTYLPKQDQKVQGVLMQIKNDNERYLQKKQLNLQGNDYIVSIECFINPKQFIVGIILISQAGKVIKGGCLEGQKRFLEMNPKEYPGCVYACIVKEGIQLIGVEKVEPQSF